MRNIATMQSWMGRGAWQATITRNVSCPQRTRIVLKDNAIVSAPRKPEKYSQVLLRFAEPLLREGIGNDDNLSTNIALSASAWNLAIIPPEGRADAMKSSLKTVPFWMRSGASWLHVITVEKINAEADAKLRYPAIIEKCGESPAQYFQDADEYEDEDGEEDM